MYGERLLPRQQTSSCLQRLIACQAGDLQQYRRLGRIDCKSYEHDQKGQDRDFVMAVLKQGATNGLVDDPDRCQNQ